MALLVQVKVNFGKIIGYIDTQEGLKLLFGGKIIILISLLIIIKIKENKDYDDRRKRII